MPLKPPKGMGPAVTTRPVPPGVRVALIVGIAVAAVLLFALDLTGVLAVLGPARYALFGLLGGAAVAIPKQTSYAAGADWIRRGDRWVVTTELTRARLDGQRLRLRDTSPRRTIVLPIDVLTHNPQMFAALATGVRNSQAAGKLSADDRTRDLFSLPHAATP